MITLPIERAGQPSQCSPVTPRSVYVNTPSRTPHSGAATPHRTPMHAMAFTPVPSPAHQKQANQAAVSVIGPGGGTGINSAVYAELARDPRFAVEIVGRSRANYDCYPECWPHGGPAPNLRSFAEDVLRQGWPEKSDAFVFGSRGGQVVLPTLWQHRGDKMPPCVVINGGVAMNLPQPIYWPDGAVTFLLLGGQDYFKGNVSAEEYLAETKRWVPAGNGTTAALFVNEMQHMPQAALLSAVLPKMLSAILSWQDTGRPPLEEMRLILAAVNKDGWSGRLIYTKAPGVWAPDIEFGPYHVARTTALAEVAAQEGGTVVEVTRQQELKALWQAAVAASKPGGGAPLAHPGARFAAAAEAAKKVQAAVVPTVPAPVAGVPTPAKKAGLMLPIPVAGSPSRHVHFSQEAMAAGYPSPGHGEARTPNRLPVPRAGHSPMGDPTPISRALGIGRQFPSPVHSHTSSPCPSPGHYYSVQDSSSTQYYQPQVVVR